MQKREYAESASLSWRGDPKVGIPSGSYEVTGLYEEIADKELLQHTRERLIECFTAIAGEPVKCMFDFEYEAMDKAMKESE